MSFHPAQTLLQEAITTNADYHDRLCATISDLAYVVAAKKEQAILVTDLKDKLERGNRLVAELSEKTARERREYEGLRDSKGRQFMHMIVGRKQVFERKQAKEKRLSASVHLIFSWLCSLVFFSIHRDHVEALEVQMKERENCQALTNQLDQAEEYVC